MLWIRPPTHWPETVEEALALPDSWNVNREFIERFAGSLPEEQQKLWIRSYTAFMWNSFVTSGWFNVTLYKAVVLFLVVGLLRQLISHRLISRLPPPLRRLHTFYVKHITLAPFFGSSNLASVSPFGRKSRLTKWTTVQIPLRLSTLCVGAYLLANACLVFGGYHPAVPSAFYPDDPTPFRQNARYLADRAGVLALGATPLVILLGARNSPFSWFAGVNFGTMQIAHRWVARATFANVGLHAAGYSYLFLMRPNWTFWSLFERPYMIFGWLAFAGGVILCFGAWRRLRQIAYEAFLVFHILAAITWVLFAYLHLLFLHGAFKEHLLLAAAASAVWAFDRVLRLVSILWNNTILGRLFFLPFPPSTNRSLAAQGSLIGATDNFLRLRIMPKSPWSRRRGGPGAYVFISSWSTLAHKGWESHPFSIAWPLGVSDPSSRNSTPASPPFLHTPGIETPTKLDDLSSSPRSSITFNERSPLLPSRPPHPFDISPSSQGFEVLIKRYSGFTRALASSLSLPLFSLPTSQFDEPLILQPEQLHHLKIAVEGPYGSEPSSAIARYRQALLVVGGSGVAAATSQLADLATQTLENEMEGSATASEVQTERVAVVWSVRESETVHLLAPYLLRLYNLFKTSPTFASKHLSPSSPSPFLDLHVFVTGADASLTEAAHAITSLRLPSSFLAVTVHNGRPDVGARIDDFSTEKELVVVSCGPASLCDAARESVRSRLHGVFSPRLAVADSLDEEGLLAGAGKTARWEASKLVYNEEAVVW